MNTPIAIGVSSCLLGERVRYDGGHKHDRYLTDTLGAFFRFVPVCPEAGCGLSTPREAMRLERDDDGVKLITRMSRIDHTDRMLAWCRRKVVELEAEDLCGFIFKKDSPSSGLFKVKVYSKGMPVKAGRGLFADAVVRHFPLLPVEEEGRLHDMALRENFIERVFAFRRWKDLVAGGKEIGRLVEFHGNHKLLLMAHSPEGQRELGKLVAHGREMGCDELFARYEELFMKTLALLATPRKNTNVLQHIAGYFKKELTKEEKVELQGVIGDYHARLVPLVVPVTLLRHYVKKFGQEYLLRQVYLSPTPTELMLRNHV